MSAPSAQTLPRPEAAPPAPADTAAELSCRSFKQLLLYFSRNYAGDLERAVARAGTLGRAYLLDENNFTSCDYAQRLVASLVAESGDPQFMKKAALASTTPEAFGFVYYVVKAFGTPRLALSKVVEVAARFNRVGDFTVDELTRTRARLRYVSRVPERERHLCEGRMWQLASLPLMWNLPPAEAREVECQVHGAPACRYEFAWTEPQGSSGVVVPSAVGLAVGLLPWALHLPAADLFLPLSTLAAGAGLGLARQRRRLLRQKDEQLSTQNEGLLRSMQDLERRHGELTQLNQQLSGLNQTLEWKVEERTRELQVASGKLQAALDKQLELDRLKTQFFQNISHELRTPLTLILAPLDSLLAEGGLGEREKGQLEVTRRSAVRLLSLINSLLDLSRLDAGKLRLSLEDLDPALLVRNLVENCQPLALQRAITLRYEGPEATRPLPLDADKVEKVVLNLVANALKFTSAEAGRRAEVTVRLLVEEELRVEVEDSGIGIPPEELESIFQRFHQVDSGDERRYGGTGIGLALVKELVEFHLGRVEVESTPGEGSRFRVLLPTSRAVYPDERLDRRRQRAEVAIDRRSERERQKLAQLIANPADLALSDLQPASEPPPVRVEVPAADPGRTRVLVADDNRDMLAYLQAILARDYDVITATDGEEAWQKAVAHQPHVVVSDVMMPRRNGYALVKELKKHPSTRSIPVILVTAKAEPYHKVAGIESGADDFLTKPFNFLELRARIRQLLKARALERSLAEKNEYLAKLNFDLVLSKKEVFLQTIEALAFALEAKDRYTHGHSRRVSLLSTELARELSLTELEVERVQIAAVLHDIGKLGIPEHILRKEGRLEGEELEIIKNHPEIGFRILESVKDLSEVNRCILLHHEQFDGGGYPYGKGGHDIPLESRIIAVADTYDAMTSDRPYRKGLGHKRAIDELQAFSGTQFDPECVRAFLKLYEARAPVFPEFPSVFTKRPA